MATCGGPARVQHRAVALHDSKLLSWLAAEGRIHLRLDAYVHASLGEPGVDPGTAWQQEVELIITEGQAAATELALPLWIVEARLTVDGHPIELPPLPFERAGSVRLEIRGSAGLLEVQGAAIRAAPLGEARFIERYPGLA